jgi:micrococcal nuclease
MDYLFNTSRTKRRAAAALLGALLTLFVMYGRQGADTAVPTNAAQSDALYPVVAVVDGDTIRVERNGVVEPVRFIGIDTPEIPLPDKAGECFGTEASKRTRELLKDMSVQLEFDTTQGERDTYGRLLAYPFLEDGTNVGELLVREGFAREYTYAAPYVYQEAFRAAARDAKRETRGLWGACKR